MPRITPGPLVALGSLLVVMVIVIVLVTQRQPSGAAPRVSPDVPPMPARHLVTLRRPPALTVNSGGLDRRSHTDLAPTSRTTSHPLIGPAPPLLPDTPAISAVGLATPAAIAQVVPLVPPHPLLGPLSPRPPGLPPAPRQLLVPGLPPRPFVQFAPWPPPEPFMPRLPHPPGLPPVPLLAPVSPPVPLLASALVDGPLDGLPTPAQVVLRRPLAIMVENYAPDSRPQTGLGPASVVFETLAEFGITRFMAVYQEQDAPVVGPVRSARIYYDHWAESLHAIFTHAGGNSDALRELWLLPDLVNIDEVATEQSLYDTGASYFSRSPDRVAPHNLYAYPALLRAHVAALGKWTEGDPVWTLAHKPDAPLAQRPASSSIDIAFSSSDYAVHYDFDRQTDTYPRFMGGAPHVDAMSGVRIAPANVVVLFTSVVPDPNGDSPGSIIVQTEGQGLAYYFMDGTMRQGAWRKVSVAAQLHFLDSAGHPVRFNPGQTWIEVVPQGNAVTWTAPAVQ